MPFNYVDYIAWRKRGGSRKASASLITLKPLTVWIKTNCGKFLDGNTRPPYLPPEKPVCGSVRTRHGKTDWFKTGKWVQ